MDLFDAMRTTGTCREYTDEPVPDELLMQAFDVARFAPQGGNQQPVSWIVVRDPELRHALKELYAVPWAAYIERVQADPRRARLDERTIQTAMRFADHLHEIPVMVVVCARTDSIAATDAGLDRLSVVGGGSIYPTVQNFMLACRALGLGTALTTLLCAREPEVKQLLGIPDDRLTAAHITVGFPAKPFPTRLRRRPAEDVVYLDRYADRLADAG